MGGALAAILVFCSSALVLAQEVAPPPRQLPPMKLEDLPAADLDAGPVDLDKVLKQLRAERKALEQDHQAAAQKVQEATAPTASDAQMKLRIGELLTRMGT